MRIVVLMETSNRVAGAFRARGHEVYSVDLLPNEVDQRWHYQIDVRDLLHRWRVMPGGFTSLFPVYTRPDLVVAHPPCTYLCNSGVRWLTTIPKIQKTWNPLRGGARGGDVQRGATVCGRVEL